MISQSEAPAPEEIEVHKHVRDTSYLSAATGETCLPGGTRVSVTPEKHIPKKKKNIKSLALSPLRKNLIKNQDKNILGLNKDQGLTPDVLPLPLTQNYRYFTI